MEFFKHNSKDFTNFKYNKFNPSVNEWINSIYTYETGWDKKNSNLINNRISHDLINSYFNMKFDVKKKVIFRRKLINWLSHLSLNRIFVSIPEFKHNLQSLNILIYVFNKEEILLLKKIKKLKSLKISNLNSNSSSKIVLLDNLKSPEKVVLNKYISNSKYISIKNNLRVRYYKIFLYKLYSVKLYFNKYKFNFNSLFYLKKILYNIYNTEISINIVNLKYLHLDNSIYVNAITRKLKDRNKKALRVLRNALILPKIPTINDLLLINKKIFVKLFGVIKNTTAPKGTGLKYLTYNDIENIKNNRKSIFYNIKNTHIVGVRLEASGRLTRRLTASRAVHKITYLGCLKNIFSSYQGLSSVINKGFERSNNNYIKMSSNNRNGAFGIKSWQNTL